MCEQTTDSIEKQHLVEITLSKSLFLFHQTFSIRQFSPIFLGSKLQTATTWPTMGKIGKFIFCGWWACQFQPQVRESLESIFADNIIW